MVEAELRVIVESAPEPTGSWPVLRVAGEVDIQTSPILQEHLERVLSQGRRSIVVDLRDVTFLDSTGLSVLVAGLKRCQEAGGDMRIERPQPNVLRVLEITGLANAFRLQVPEDGGTSG